MLHFRAIIFYLAYFVECLFYQYIFIFLISLVIVSFDYVKIIFGRENSDSNVSDYDTKLHVLWRAASPEYKHENKD